MSSEPTLMTDPAADESALAWRIPQHRGSTSLRAALLRVAFAAVAVGLLVTFCSPAESQTGLLSATAVIALLVAGVRVLQAVREARRPPNVWLDAHGLHWRDAEDRAQMLPRALVQGFYLGRDDQTQREITSLTLLLDESFVSQPMELHAPVDEAAVRGWLRLHWQLAEAEQLPEVPVVSLAVVSEIDVPNLHWYLEATAENFHVLVDLFRRMAEFPLPPTGARPRMIKANLGHDELVLWLCAYTWLDQGLFGATPEKYRSLAAQFEAHVASAAARDELEFPLAADTGHHWKVIVNVLEPTES